MEYKGRYLVNIRTYTIHDTLNRKKGCKLDMMHQSNALFCDTIQEAEEYPNKITPKTKRCKYCLSSLNTL